MQELLISRIQIERPAKNVRVTIYAGKPGIILGKKGGDVDALRKELGTMLGVPVHVNIEEIKKIDLDAKLVAEQYCATVRTQDYVSSGNEARSTERFKSWGFRGKGSC